MKTLTKEEQHVLDIIQYDFPLALHPYEAIGHTIGKTEEEVIEILRSLKSRAIIRQISAIFNGRFIGFNTALISFQISESTLEEAAHIVSAHPGVSHNYQRVHPYNLWFTLSVPQELVIEDHVQALARRTSCSRYLYLPGVKTFKRRVQFHLHLAPKTSKTAFQVSEAAFKMSSKITLSEELQCGIMQELQQDLPLTRTPFTDLARQFHIETKTLFQFLAYLKATKKMSRFAGILRHRNLGFTANAMVVWNVPTKTVEAFAQYASEKSEISHCYERVTYPEWPYNLYTMIHGTSLEKTQKIIDDLLTKFPMNEYEILYSGKEFKKQRVDYFSNAIYEWHTRWVGEKEE